MPVLTTGRFGASTKEDNTMKRKHTDRTKPAPAASRRGNPHVGLWAKPRDPSPRGAADDNLMEFAWQTRRLNSTKTKALAPPLSSARRRRTEPEDEDMLGIIEAYTKMVLERTECIQEVAQKRFLPHSKKRPPTAQQRVYMPTSRIRRAVQSAGTQRPVSAQPSLMRIRVLNTVPNMAPPPADSVHHTLAPAIDKAATTSIRHGVPPRVLPPRCMSATPRRKVDAAMPRPQSAHPRSTSTAPTAPFNKPTVELAENGKVKLTVHMAHIRMENNDEDVDEGDDGGGNADG
ncbi:hypothetical protein H310_10419 [Aphanomyces invadans]|uniref:Uncharacterized protein n=1 Tax=Aphanomyces invadans TaxID=157072 RepID=A0A024TQ13_9STRA|nr:hypothetical protein H310_10419 [Aphanomyces invadans]ETV96235.1 hypothetical protein H310_10419 [Aphanomyces invadans]|eukprot:XP_008875027.1 hypothetical protein H310_10419 [Aphanomyces invadans]